MKIVTASEMQRIDKAATEKYAIPSIIMMENAATASAFCALQMLKTAQDNVVVFCGPGNNGGDGFACTRHLIQRGIKAKVYFLGQEKRLSLEAKTNYLILRKIGQRIVSLENEKKDWAKSKISSLQRELANNNLIIDALLGIGLKRNVRQPYFTLIELINNSRKPVLSLDIPSGLDATSGQIHGIAVRARRTITFGLYKKGFLHSQAPKYTGRITIGDIGLPRRLLY